MNEKPIRIPKYQYDESIPKNNNYIAIKVPEDYRNRYPLGEINQYIDFSRGYVVGPYSCHDVLEPVNRTQDYIPASMMFNPKWQYDRNYDHSIDNILSLFVQRFGRHPRTFNENPILIKDPLDADCNYFRLAVLSFGDLVKWMDSHPKSGEVLNYDYFTKYGKYLLVFESDGVHAHLIKKGEMNNG